MDTHTLSINDTISILQSLHERVTKLEALNNEGNPNPHDYNDDTHGNPRDTSFGVDPFEGEHFIPAQGQIEFIDIHERTHENAHLLTKQYYTRRMWNGHVHYVPVVITTVHNLWGTTTYKIRDREGRNSNVREVTRDKLYEANPNINPGRVR